MSDPKAPLNDMTIIKTVTEINNAVLATTTATTDMQRAQAVIELVAVLTRLGFMGAGKPASVNDDVELLQGVTDDVEDDYSDNPNDENYRYADTGYIAGSHKEQAGKRIKDLSKDGQTVKTTDIEWDEIESDPLFAEDIIKKSNIIGEVDYQAMKDAGGDAATAFMIQKVLASVAPTPHWDLSYFIKNSMAGNSVTKGLRSSDLAELFNDLEKSGVAEQQKRARKAYVMGINSLKARIIDIKDIRTLVAELKLMAAEMRGFNVNAKESEEYLHDLAIKNDTAKALTDKSDKLKADYAAALSEAIATQGISEKDADMAYYSRGEFSVYTGRVGTGYFKRRAILDWLNDKDRNANYNEYGVSKTNSAILSRDDHTVYRDQIRAVNVKRVANSVYALKNDMTSLAWVSLGERFWGIIELTSGAFVKHANMGLNKKYDDWGLVIKDDKPSDSGEKPKGKKKKTFELIVADKITRIGGEAVTIKSTSELKDAFGFRDIQSGSWVLNDKDSAKFHVENAAASMLDLSDVVGIDPQSLAFGGRLALAFGARGRSGALAHYESDTRVINITKMRGGGSLGHEWFHAIDNILGEVMGVDGATGAGNFLSKTPDIIGDNILASRFKELQDVMTKGVTRAPEKFTITKTDFDLAALNVKETARNSVAKIILDAGNAETAVLEVDKYLQSKWSDKRSTNHKRWRKIAAAYYSAAFIDSAIYLNTGDFVSEFYANSKRLDAGKSKPYWSSLHEMAARSFQAFLEDSLADQGRRNDYLSFGADNNLYQNHKAYPEGDERREINAMFKRLFETIKSEKIFENATGNQAMMDSIFGIQDDLLDYDIFY